VHKQESRRPVGAGASGIGPALPASHARRATEHLPDLAGAHAAAPNGHGRSMLRRATHRARPASVAPIRLRRVLKPGAHRDTANCVVSGIVRESRQGRPRLLCAWRRRYRLPIRAVRGVGGVRAGCLVDGREERGDRRRESGQQIRREGVSVTKLLDCPTPAKYMDAALLGIDNPNFEDACIEIAMDLPQYLSRSIRRGDHLARQLWRGRQIHAG
jgi:hypothetical protein